MESALADASPDEREAAAQRLLALSRTLTAPADGAAEDRSVTDEATTDEEMFALIDRELGRT